MVSGLRSTSGSIGESSFEPYCPPSGPVDKGTRNANKRDQKKFILKHSLIQAALPPLFRVREQDSKSLLFPPCPSIRRPPTVLSPPRYASKMDGERRAEQLLENRRFLFPTCLDSPTRCRPRVEGTDSPFRAVFSASFPLRSLKFQTPRYASKDGREKEGKKQPLVLRNE